MANHNKEKITTRRNKQNQTNYQEEQEENTTNKLIALISQISSRLDYIENSIEALPNRS